MGKKCYCMIPGVNMDVGEKNFDIEDMKLVVIDVVSNNNLNDLHNFIYHCQNADIGKLDLLQINTHKLLWACIEVKHAAIVLKGDPGRSKSWLKNKFAKHMKNLNTRWAIMEKVNAKIKNANVKEMR